MTRADTQKTVTGMMTTATKTTIGATMTIGVGTTIVGATTTAAMITTSEVTIIGKMRTTIGTRTNAEMTPARAGMSLIMAAIMKNADLQTTGVAKQSPVNTTVDPKTFGSTTST